ncbi:MAG: aminotransferase class IV [Thermodesulfobacteriota bacterium]
MKAWVNGQFVEWDKANVSLLSHSFGRGSAIFEVLDIVETDNGPAFFGLNEHLDRFFNSARLTFMDLPLNREEIVRLLVETALTNNVTEGLLKFFAYYPLIELHATPANPQVDIAVFSVDFKLFGIKQADLSAPVAAGISTFRKLHPDTVPVAAKVVGNYVNACLAKMEVKKRGFEDVIMLDTRGFVAEGATANVFLVKEGKVLTPTLRCALAGVTRRTVLELLRDMDMEPVETDIRPDVLTSAEEAFYTASVIKVKPIKSIEGRPIGRSCPGPVTQAISDRLTEALRGRIDWFQKCLIPVK